VVDLHGTAGADAAGEVDGGPGEDVVEDPGLHDAVLIDCDPDEVAGEDVVAGVAAVVVGVRPGRAERGPLIVLVCLRLGDLHVVQKRLDRVHIDGAEFDERLGADEVGHGR
jgi:hypothetical protein